MESRFSTAHVASPPSLSQGSGDTIVRKQTSDKWKGKRNESALLPYLVFTYLLTLLVPYGDQVCKNKRL